MSPLSLMQQPTTRSHCGRPYQSMQPQPAFCSVRSSHLKAKPDVLTSRSSRVAASYGLAADGPHSNAIKSPQVVCTPNIQAAENELGMLPLEHGRWKAGRLKALLQLVGCAGVLVYAFGDFGLISGQQTLNPIFSDPRWDTIGAGVLVTAMSNVLNTFLSLRRAHSLWTDYEKRCVANWGRGVVDYFLMAQQSKSEYVLDLFKKPQEPIKIDAGLCERVKASIRGELVKKVLQKRKGFIDAFGEAGGIVVKLIGAFVLFKCVQLRLLCAFPALVAPASQFWIFEMLYYLCVEISLLSAISDAYDDYVELKLAEGICVAWYGKESIESWSI